MKIISQFYGFFFFLILHSKEEAHLYLFTLFPYNGSKQKKNPLEEAVEHVVEVASMVHVCIVLFTEQECDHCQQAQQPDSNSALLLSSPMSGKCKSQKFRVTILKHELAIISHFYLLN